MPFKSFFQSSSTRNQHFAAFAGELKSERIYVDWKSQQISILDYFSSRRMVGILRKKNFLCEFVIQSESF